MSVRAYGYLILSCALVTNALMLDCSFFKVLSNSPSSVIQPLRAVMTESLLLMSSTAPSTNHCGNGDIMRKKLVFASPCSPCSTRIPSAPTGFCSSFRARAIHCINHLRMYVLYFGLVTPKILYTSGNRLILSHVSFSKYSLTGLYLFQSEIHTR